MSWVLSHHIHYTNLFDYLFVSSFVNCFVSMDSFFLNIKSILFPFLLFPLITGCANLLFGESKVKKMREAFKFSLLARKLHLGRG